MDLSWPIVLRKLLYTASECLPHEEIYRIVGFAYYDGIMENEWIDQTLCQDIKRMRTKSLDIVWNYFVAETIWFMQVCLHESSRLSIVLLKGYQDMVPEVTFEERACSTVNSLQKSASCETK